MTNPVLFEMYRGELLESWHRGSFVISRSDGTLLAAAGDIDAVVYPRSSYKMIQALPLVTSGAADQFKVTDEELSLACASHNGEPMHVVAVEAWLKRLGLKESDLECGPHEPFFDDTRNMLVRIGEVPTRLHNNCSGKHTGFLTLAKHLDVPTKGYLALDHPVQLQVRDAIAKVCDMDGASLHAGTDGCAAPNLAMPLRSLSVGFARLGTGDGISAETFAASQRLFAAQVRFPRQMSGTDRACAALIDASNGRAVVKTGAEGVYAGLVPDLGLGIALKIDDGAKRASEAAIAALMVALGIINGNEAPIQKLLNPPWTNTCGAVVGEGRITDMLRPDLTV